MTARPSSALGLALFVLGLLSGCATPPKPAPPIRYVSPQQRTANDQAFYRAVTAYVQGDYTQAETLLRKILRSDPRNKDALALRRRVQAAERLSAR